MIMTAIDGGDTTERDRILAMIEIDRATRLGSEEINQNHLPKAIDHLHNAYKLSRQLNDDVTERACAFNLGAAYITVKNAEKGLEFLQRAVPPLNRRDGLSNGDLYQNFALGYEMLNNQAEMIRYFELALDEYRRENLAVELEIAIGVKVAKALANSKQHEKSANFYGRVADLYGNIGDQNGRAEALLMRSKELAKVGGAEYARSLDVCLEACDLVQDRNLICKVLEDLGLAYTQLKQYEKAVSCFGQELDLAQKSDNLRERQAVTNQNLGALYNSNGQYEQAVCFHQAASKIFGELGKRRNQGHCFVNLAFAHARLGDVESAGEAYLHALLAARDTREDGLSQYSRMLGQLAQIGRDVGKDDVVYERQEATFPRSELLAKACIHCSVIVGLLRLTGDKKAEWQAAEGLAAVAFLRGQTDKAIHYYKQALSALGGLENESKSQERIMAKLTDALQAKISPSSHTSVRTSARSEPHTSVRTSARSELRSQGSSQPRQQPLNVPGALDTMPPDAVNEKTIVPHRSQYSAGASTAVGEPETADRKRKEKDVIVRVNSVQNTSGEIHKPRGSLKRRDDCEDHKYKFSLGIGEYDSDSDSLSDKDRASSAEADRLSEEMDGMLQKYRDQQSDYQKNRPGTARADQREQQSAQREALSSDGESESESSVDENERVSGGRVVDAALTSSHQDQSLINVGDSLESDLEWKSQAAKFLATGSATTNSGTTDSSSHNRQPDTENRGQHEQLERHVAGISLISDTDEYTTDTDSSAGSASPKESTVERRPIHENLQRRPIGGKKLSDSSLPMLERSESIPKTTDTAVKNNAGTSIPEQNEDDDRRLSVDSEGITSPKKGQPRHLSAVMKLRESFVDETGSEADDHVYASIDPQIASACTKPPHDPLEATYESGTFFLDDKTTDLGGEASKSSSSESNAEPLNEEEEALYATGAAEEPSTSQTVFPSPARTPRDGLVHTGPLQPPPRPAGDTDTPRMSAAERELFRREYQRKKDELRLGDEQRLYYDRPVSQQRPYDPVVGDVERQKRNSGDEDPRRPLRPTKTRSSLCSVM